MSGPMDVHRAGDLVRYLDDDEYERLLGYTEVAEVVAGSVILHRGAPSRSLILVETGEVEVIDENGTALVVFKDGEVTGEVGFVDGQERMHDVRARSVSRLRRLTRDRVMELSRTDPAVFGKVMLGIAEIMARRFRDVVSELAPARAFAARLGEPEDLHAEFDEIDEELPVDALQVLREVAGKAALGLGGI